MNNKQLEFKYHTTPFEQMWNKGFFHSKYEPNSEYRWVDTDTPENAVNDDKWTYKFNEWGFRSAPFTERSDANILISGCSITVGIGVEYENTWGQLLKRMFEQQLGKTVTVWNLAQGSCSPDYTVRSIHNTIELFKPDLVAVCWPADTRFELPSDDPATPEVIRDYQLGDDDYPKMFVRDGWGPAQHQKNIIFLKMLCEQHDAKLIHGPGDNTDFGINPDNTARDGSHPGNKWHKEYAELVFEHYNDKY